MAATQPLSDLVERGWAHALEPAAEQISHMGEYLRREVAEGRGYLPARENVLRAFNYPFDEVRVIVVGQDPYPTPGLSMGLCFAVERSVRQIPPSLRNIYRELHDDLGIVPPSHGDLTAWAEQGVLLLNRVLTVRPGVTGSHRGKGWEAVTDVAIRALVARGGPLVAILWGKDAAGLAPMLGATPTVVSAHPSPLSAHRGFLGSKPFTRANELLVAQGAMPVDWTLPN